MKKYLQILRLGWLDALEYRTEFFVSIIGWGIRLLIAVFLWLAVSEARGGTVGTYTFHSILAYFFLTQIISSLIFSRVGFDIAFDIYRGDFANFLLKPMNYLVFRLVHELSKNVLRTLISLVIFGSILFIFLDGIPFAFWKIPLGVVALMGAYVINFCLVTAIALLAFWITNATRLTFIYFGILTIFSGMIAPIDLFPPNFITFFERLPFAYIFFFPAKILQSPTFDPHFTSLFLIQWAYAIGLFGFVWLMYLAGVRKFEAVGR